MGTREEFASDGVTPEVTREEAAVLTVFRSRRKRPCSGCDAAIQPGDDYFRVGFDSYHRDCLPDVPR